MIMSTDLDKVIVVWGTKDDLASGSISVLDSHGGTRIYTKDKVDTRLLSSSENLRYFDDLNNAMNYIASHPMQPVQLALTEARRCNLV